MRRAVVATVMAVFATLVAGAFTAAAAHAKPPTTQCNYYNADCYERGE